MAKLPPRLSPEDVQLVIATAWDDKPPFYRTMVAHGIAHGPLVALMKRELTPNAFKTWMARSQGKGPSPAGKRR